ncbi:fatty acid CoA ligase Acsl3-like [Cylas formicarius]|uniref:fatty acid CoA ligase Acsl3-like n=1 Tax=Cylas formicarius TaxID=197179 RepID=UPI002958AB63|nr:fatty acid CoA ligase Acsl3-like [Cylas formicarius]
MDVGETGIGFKIGLALLNSISFVFDITTYIVYCLTDLPWSVKSKARCLKSTIVNVEKANAESHTINVFDAKNEKVVERLSIKNKSVQKMIGDAGVSVTYKRIFTPSKIHSMLQKENIDTLEKVLNYVSQKFSSKRCLGTRELLNEEDEIQANGRVFKKFNFGDYHWKTYSQVSMLATNFGRGLREIGCVSNENVVIFAETRAEWMIAAHGLFKQNMLLVTIYATLGEEAIAYGINQTEVSVVITSHELMPKFTKILHMTPKVTTLIYMEDQLKTLDTSGYKEGVTIYPFSEILKMGATSDKGDNPPSAEDAAIIMYTSGSTDVPKGVILQHKNLIATMKAFSDVFEISEDNVMIGFLPLAHVFELLVESIALCAGVPIGYSSPLTVIDSASKIKKGTKGDASVLRPTVMTAVPLILDRISKGIHEKVKKSGSFKKLLFKFAYDYKIRWTARGFKTRIIDRIVFSNIQMILGGRMKYILTGGAPLSADTQKEITTCLCAHVIQGYGLTESTSAACVENITTMQYGRVGPPCSTCLVKIVNWDEGNYTVQDKPWPRGEMIVGGDNVAAGYYKLPGKSKEDFYEEGGKRWFRTGDIGEVHEDGVFKIIDRKKDLVKLQAGEYVSLGKVETHLKTCPLVENVCVYGEGTQQFCVALIVPHPNHLEQLAKNKGIPEGTFEELCNSDQLAKIVTKELADHLKKGKLEKFEIPGAVKLVPEAWTPESGLVTAALKIKRKEIQKYYEKELKELYAT